MFWKVGRCITIFGQARSSHRMYITLVIITLEPVLSSVICLISSGFLHISINIVSVEVYWKVLYWQKKMAKKVLSVMINCLIQPTHFCTETRAWLVADSFEPKTQWDNNHLKRVKFRFVARFVIAYFSFCSDLTLQIAKEYTFYAEMLWGAQKSNLFWIKPVI